jgi:ferrous iron transport protein A
MAVVASRNPEPVSLASLRKGASGVVSAVLESDSSGNDDVASASIRRRLAEVGFVAGETIEVIETVWPSGDPMAVRIGSSVFALRRREALAVMVQLGLK